MVTPYKFPEVDFSPIGELPKVYEEARGTSTRKTTLANLDTSDPESMRQAATKLYASGNLANMEMALKLHQAALAQEQLRQKREFEQAYIGAVGPIIGGLKGANQPPTQQQPQQPTVEPGTTLQSPGGAPPQVPVPWGSGGALPGPGGLPAGAAPAPQAPPSAPANPNMTELNPLTGGPPPPRGPQLAQAGPIQELPPVDVGRQNLDVTGGGLPPWMQGQQQINPLRTQPLGGAPPSAAEPSQLPQLPALHPELQREVDKITEISASMGRLTSPSQRNVVAERLKAVLAKTEWSPAVKGWHEVRMDRWARGESDISLQQYQDDQKTLIPRYEEALKTAAPFRDDAIKGQKLQTLIGSLQAISSNPQFSSGTGTSPIVMRFGSMVSGLRDSLRAYGVPEELLPSVERFAKPAALMETFQALTNQAVVATLGGLGNQISNPDRDYITASFPNLAFTLEGNKLLLRVMDATAKRNIEIGRVVSDYKRRAGSQATAEGVMAAVDKYASENPIWRNQDGSFTAFGREVAGEVAKSSNVPRPMAPAQPLSVQPTQSFPRGPQQPSATDVQSMPGARPQPIPRPPGARDATDADGNKVWFDPVTGASGPR